MPIDYIVPIQINFQIKLIKFFLVQIVAELFQGLLEFLFCQGFCLGGFKEFVEIRYLLCG